MKYYYYFLYRLYWVFRDFSKEGHKIALISTSIASTFVLYFTLYTIMGLIFYFKESQSLYFEANYKFWILLLLATIWFLNYYFFIKRGYFLEKDFSKDRKGGVIILLIIIGIGVLFVLGANKNREKISGLRGKIKIECKK